MIGMRTTERSLRAVRIQAAVPRALAVIVVLVLCTAGLRTIIAGPSRAAVTRTIVTARGDQGAETFAESFVHAYLTWNADDPDVRTSALAPYVNAGLDTDAGLQPGAGVDQSVRWTAVVADTTDGARRAVTVEAQTSRALMYLNIPVQRTAQGYLAIAGLPAIVGPPAAAQRQPAAIEETVQDDSLISVVQRAVANYLAGNRDNLLADLTPDALVSLPAQHLQVVDDGAVTWASPGRRVAAVVDAQDPNGTTWTLRYELEVLRRDRWYVQSLQVDPTFQGGS
jgi:hypothetical protein